MSTVAEVAPAEGIMLQNGRQEGLSDPSYCPAGKLDVN